jgi:UPF0755 protein
MRRAAAWAALVVALLLVTAAVLTWRVRASLSSPFQGYPGDSLSITIEEGASARRILSRLEREGVIASAFWARVYLSRVAGDPTLKAGEYSFSGPTPAVAVLDKLVRGEVVTHPLTLVEGLDLFEAATRMATGGFGDEAAFLRLVQRPDLVASLDPEATSLEGYLFPDTYHFARGTSEEEVVATLVATFRRRFEEEVAPLLGPDPGLSVRELVTLASIVEKETSLDEERPVVAGVYRNRLDRGMGLFADPTVIYGLKLAGSWDGNLRRSDLEADDPYNTYRIAGLPPGPICSPGLASLLAAARPAETPYLYFVSRNDGSHVFARTLAEHNRNVRTWQQRYWRERWARERAEKELQQKERCQ